MPLPFLTGFARGMTKQREAQTQAETEREKLAYQSMLRGQERAIPQALAPEQAGLLQAQTGAIGEQTDIQRQQLAQQDFQNTSNLWISTIDENTGEFRKGMEGLGMRAEASLYQNYSPAFQKGGALEKGGGETPQEANLLNAVRTFVNSPTAENRKKIKTLSGITPPTQIQPLARTLKERIGGRGAEYAEAVKTYGANKAGKIISKLRTLVQQGTSIQQLRTWLEEADLNADLFLKFYD